MTTATIHDPQVIRFHVPSELPRVEPYRHTTHWFDPGDAKGHKGHTHTYSFRTLRCESAEAPNCKVLPATYQYVNIPGEPLPLRPQGRAIVPIYRQDLENNWTQFQVTRGLHMYYAYGMMAEYPAAVWLPEDEPVDTDGVWLG